MKGQNLAQRLAHLVVGGEGDALARFHLPALQLQPQLQKKELFEDQPSVRRRGEALQLGKRSAFGGEVRLAQRGLAVGQRKPIQNRLRQAFRRRAAQPFQQIEDHLALPARGQTAAAQRLVDRRNPPYLEQSRFGVGRRVGQKLVLRLNNFKVARRARWFHLAVDGDRLPGLEFAFKIGRVKPDAFEGLQTLANG